MTARMFTELDDTLADALGLIVERTQLPKRAVIEATLAINAGLPHRDDRAVRAAWLQLRKENAR